MKAQDDTKAYIMSLIKEVITPGTKSQPSVASIVETPAPTYHSILKRATNHKA
jgi:hypothetical protein